jgi:hypothetical protein
MSEGTKTPHPENGIIQQLRNSSEPLDEIFRKHKDVCINYMRKMRMCDEDTVNGIYTDAIIVLYEKAQKMDFCLTCSIQTYLVSVCKNQVLVRFGDGIKHPTTEFGNEEEVEPNITDWFGEPESINEERVKVIEEVLREFKNSKGNCYELLMRFYYKKQAYDRIAYEMDYTNADNAKNQNGRCRKRLKELVFQRLNNN